MLSLFRDKELRATGVVFGLVSIFILATLLFSTFPWIVFLLTFSIAAAFIVAHPRAGLYTIILLTMIWERFFTLQSLVVSGRVIKLYPLDILLLITTASFLLQWFIERHHRKLLRHPHAPAPHLLRTFGAFEKLLILFALLGTVYFFASQVVGVREPEIAFSTFKNYAFYMLLTFLVLGLMETSAHLRRLIRVMLAGGVGILIFLMIGFWRGEGLWTEFTPLSTEGVRYLAFPHAYYLMLALLMAMSLWAHRLFRRPFVMLLLMGLQCVGLLASLMRHLWIAFGVGALVLVVTSPKPTQKQFLRSAQWVLGIVLVILFFGGIAAVMFPESSMALLAKRFLDPLIARITSFGNVGEDLSALWRLKLWQTTVARFLASPLFGIGFGQEITFDLRGYVSTIRLRDLHNSLFGVLVQTGIVGFALFVAFNVSLIVSYLRRRVQCGVLRPFADGAFAAYLAFLVAANFQPYLETNILHVPFWILLGVIRVAPYLVEHHVPRWGHLRSEKHLRALEGTHNRGTLFRE